VQVAGIRGLLERSMVPVVLSSPKIGLRQPQEHSACTRPWPGSWVMT
jgi:hypothetical protein